MSVSAIQSDSSSFYQTFFNVDKGRFVHDWIKHYLPIRSNSEFYSLDNLERRLSKAPVNSNKITKVFITLSSIVGWAAFAAQIGMTHTNILDLDKSSSLSKDLNYAIIGFPLSSLIGVKLGLSELSLARKTKDIESVDYQVSNIAISIFSVIGGIFFVMSKFAAESAVSFGTSILALPFYGISYLIDIGKKSYQTQKVRCFKKEFNQFIKNDSDLDDTRKLKKSLKFLLNQIYVTDEEKRSIEFAIDLNEELKRNPQLKAERIQKKIDDLILIKYAKLEKKIGKKAAKSFRENVKAALNDLNRFSPKKELAKNLVQEIQSGIFAEIRNSVIMILIKIASIVGFVVATILSGGTLAPVFTIL